MLKKEEIQVLRTLAEQYMTYALTDRQKELQLLWCAHNTGHAQRPMVLIDQIPWNEMDVDGSLICQIEDPYWRGVEQELRRKIYQAVHMPADMLLPPYMLIPRILTDYGFREFGVAVNEEIRSTDSTGDVLSHAYTAQFETMEDLEKIHPTSLHVNKEAEQTVMQEALHIFGGIAPVYWQGVSLHSGLWDTISQWQGVETCYYMLLDQPELLHAMMERMTQYTLQLIRQGNEDGLFDTASGICHCSHTITQPFGCGMEDRPGISQNSWTFGLAQLFSSTSPAVTEEFEIPYVSRIFAQFGNVYYGCCEKLDDRLDIITRLPNVRKISCCPWSDQERFAASLPSAYIMSQKPNPAFMASGDMEAMRRHMQRTCDAARTHHVRLEMILKDISTVQYHPERLWEFSRMAEELVQK